MAFWIALCSLLFFHTAQQTTTQLTLPTAAPSANCSAVTCLAVFCPNPIPTGPNGCCGRCNQDCRLVRCARPPCPNPIVPPGECCGVCPNVSANCSAVTCPAVTCPNPIPAGPNECCPRCPQICPAVICPTPPCANPVIPPGGCCGVCPNGSANCSAVTCPAVSCPNPIPAGPNECCPRCNQDCALVLCLRPPCANPITPPGECCGRCPPVPGCPIRGQVFSNCGGACRPTCANPTLICTLQCVPGCTCPTGMVIDTVGNRCVAPRNCPRRRRCPRTCSRRFCKANPRAICTNPGPREIPGCTGRCQVTFCKACYFSTTALARPRNCPQCHGRHRGLRLWFCLKRWARCVRKRYRRGRYRCPAKTNANFRCWNPPCPHRG